MKMKQNIVHFIRTQKQKKIIHDAEINSIFE